MADKVTVMVLKVDLQCPCCYKKIKKILCKFPQIRDQIFDEKANTVTITVVCCSPEKIRDKLCCKGSKVIKSIEIKDPPKPKPPAPEKPKEAPKPDPPKPPAPEKPKEAPKPDPPPKPPAPEKPKPDPPAEKPKEAPKPGPPKPPAPDPNPPPVTVFEPCHVDGFPPHFPPRTCCGPCSAGYGGGPCYHGYGVPPPPQPCYDGYYGYGYGQSRSCPVSRCEYYFNEENPQSCTIM